MELKGQIRRRIGVRFLFVRQADIESDRWRPGVGRTAICSLHDARSSACRDDIITDTVVRNQRAAALRRDPAETPRFVVPVRRMIGVNRRGTRRRPRARAAKHHHGRPDGPRPQPLLGLLVFDLQANPAHRVAKQKIRIERGKAERRRVLLCAVIDHGSDLPDWTDMPTGCCRRGPPRVATFPETPEQSHGDGPIAKSGWVGGTPVCFES